MSGSIAKLALMYFKLFILDPFKHSNNYILVKEPVFYLKLKLIQNLILYV